MTNASNLACDVLSGTWKIVTVTLVLLASLNSNVLAQSSFTQSRSISIGVAAGLSVYTNRPLNFGTVVSGTGGYSVPVTGANAGKVTISGQKNKSVYVTLTPPSTLVSGSNSIAYTQRAACSPSADDPSTATEWVPSTGTQSAITLRGNSHGQTAEAYIYIFDSVNVGSVPAGTYSGTYVVAASY